MRKFNFKIIIYFLGLLLLFNGSFMLITALISGIYKDGVTLSISLSAIITNLLGGFIMYHTQNHKKELKKREGYIIVTLGWIIMSISGTLPYLLTETITSFSDAIFETVSGYTTTGASVIDDIESLPKGILFWRSMTHWIGGMGIIVLAIAILPLLGIGGMQLFFAEAPGPNTYKLHPRITDTAKRLWFIYLGYTLLETLLLSLAGMSFFDAINHSMSTISSGGFSTKNANLAYWNSKPIIQYIVIFFMFLSGTNFVMSYFVFKGQFKKILHDEEFRSYFALILCSLILVCVSIYFFTDSELLLFNTTEESIFRNALFQVISVITTTGFVTYDYTAWTPFVTVFFFGLMFFGGSAGSTSGGVKIVRHLLMLKNGLLQFKRTVHPNAIIFVNYNNKPVSHDIIYNILAFIIFYMLLFIIGAFILGTMGLDFITSLGTAASTLGNVGPSFGSLNPLENYASLSLTGKYWCCFLMLLGRLELFTVLILFTKYFWQGK